MVWQNGSCDFRGLAAGSPPYRSGDDAERLSPAESAFREWCFFVTTLKLPDELYWDLTPREIDGCVLEFYRQQDVINTRFGTICATLFNVQPQGKGRKKVLEWTHFFRRITSRKTKPQTLQELQAEVLASQEALAGGKLRQQ